MSGGGIIVIGGGGHQGGGLVVQGGNDPVARKLTPDEVAALIGALDSAGLTDICEKIKACVGE